MGRPYKHDIRLTKVVQDTRPADKRCPGDNGRDCGNRQSATIEEEAEKRVISPQQGNKLKYVKIVSQRSRRPPKRRAKCWATSS